MILLKSLAELGKTAHSKQRTFPTNHTPNQGLNVVNIIRENKACELWSVLPTFKLKESVSEN